MFCFVGAVWVDWRDKASPYRVTDDTAASKIASKEKMVDVYPKSVLTIIATELVVGRNGSAEWGQIGRST
jgi:hypothetical protein